MIQLSSQNSLQFSKTQQIKAFEYPYQAILQNKYTSFSQFLNQLSSHQSNNHIRLFKIIKKTKYIYMKCKFCSAHINFITQQNQLIIRKFYILHEHRINKIKKQQQQRIISFIEQNTNLNFSQLKLLVTNRYHITNRRFYYIFNKINEQKSFDDFLENTLNRQNFQTRIHFQQGQDIPQLLITTNKNMLENFYTWGDIVYFDVTYNLFKQANNKGKKLGLGIFAGVNSNFRIIIFALSMIAQQSTLNFKKLFSNFLTFSAKSPTVIITDQQNSIIAALKQLKQQQIFKGIHLLDVYHILKNLKKRVTKQQLLLYRSALKVQNQNQFNQIINKLLYQLESDQSILQKFVQNSFKYAFSMIPKIFFGFTSSNSVSQKLNDLIKARIPHQMNFTRAFKNILILQNQLYQKAQSNQQQKIKYEQIFKDQSLKKIRLQVSRKIFTKFLRLYSKGLKYSIKNSGSHFICQNSNNKFLIKKKNNKYQCECDYRQKTGLGCCHIIKLLWQIGQQNSYIQYLNIRWIFRKKISKIKQKRGKPKKSRRNKIS